MVTASMPSAISCSRVSNARQPASSVARARCSAKGSTIPTSVIFGNPPRTRAWLVPITPAPITPTRIRFPSFDRPQTLPKARKSWKFAETRPPALPARLAGRLEHGNTRFAALHYQPGRVVRILYTCSADLARHHRITVSPEPPPQHGRRDDAQITPKRTAIDVAAICL